MRLNSKKTYLLLPSLLLMSFSSISHAQLVPKATSATPMVISISQPRINASPYHKPFVAVWLETPKRKAVTTISLWYEKYKNGQPTDHGKDYLPALKSWWLKSGKNQTNKMIDGYSGATRIPKTHIIKWNGKTQSGTKVAAGTYILNIEASREEGGYELLRKKITLGKAGTLSFTGKKELGQVRVSWK